MPINYINESERTTVNIPFPLAITVRDAFVPNQPATLVKSTGQKRTNIDVQSQQVQGFGNVGSAPVVQQVQGFGNVGSAPAVEERRRVKAKRFNVGGSSSFKEDDCEDLVYIVYEKYIHGLADIGKALQQMEPDDVVLSLFPDINTYKLNPFLRKCMKDKTVLMTMMANIVSCLQTGYLCDRNAIFGIDANNINISDLSIKDD